MALTEWEKLVHGKLEAQFDLDIAAVMVFGATVFAAEKYIGISSFFQEVGNKMPEKPRS